MKEIPGYGACLCSICGEIFTVVANFDRHLIRDHNPAGNVAKVRCCNPAKVGLVQNGRRIWMTPATEDRIPHFAHRPKRPRK